MDPTFTTFSQSRQDGQGEHPRFLFTILGVFPRGAYRVLEIYRGSACVHRTCVFPRSFRFPFMTREDLQVGDVWTDPTCRGQGLATFAWRRVTRDLARPGRNIWCLIEPGNKSSLRTAEKAGLRCVARGRRVARWGVMLLGQFVIDDWLSERW